MNKAEKVSVPLPDHERSIVFEADLTNEDDLKFKARLEAAAALKPKSLQELFISLATLKDLATLNGQEEHSKSQ